LATRTCTVVFTDLANYTASVGRSDREGMHQLIAAHKSMVTPILSTRGGEIIKSLGDSFLVLFPAATDAVRAGIELVESINGADGFHIRVAMATGDIEAIAGDAFGEVVNLAHRILSRTPVGQVWLSESTLLCMNEAEVAWESVGRYTLKGIPREVGIQRAVPRDRAWLAEPVVQAIRTGRMVRYTRGSPPPRLPPQPIILLEGFAPGSPDLEDAVDALPVVDPASLWLVAYTIPARDRSVWEKSGRGVIIGTRPAIDEAIQETRRRLAYTSGSDTIIIDTQASAIFELVLSGLALPTVPMSEVVAGYTYDLLADGRWVNSSDRAIARIDVSPGRISLTAQVGGLRVEGRQLEPGRPTVLTGGEVIQIPSGSIRYVPLPEGAYQALLLGSSHQRMGVCDGQTAEIGREPHHPGLSLPDRRGQDNIRWCPGFRAARARESGFTMDRALAGRRQAAVRLEDGIATLIGIHDRCPTFVLEGSVLEGSTLVQLHAPRPIQPGEVIVTGTSAVAIEDPTD
jgi:class 3 adenylate cyclase